MHYWPISSKRSVSLKKCTARWHVPRASHDSGTLTDQSHIVYHVVGFCGDRLLTSPCLLHNFYHNVQWGCRFTYLHMYLYQSLSIPVYAYAARHSCAALANCRPVSDLVSPVCCHVTVGHVTAAVFKLWARSAVLFATLWHCRELSDKWYAHHIQFEFWVLWRLTPAVTDRSLPVLRCQQSVPSVPSTTLCANVLTACC